MVVPQPRSLGRRDSLGFVRDKYGQLLIPDDPNTRRPGEVAQKRERCFIAVVCWVAFGAVYSAGCLLWLDAQCSGHQRCESSIAVQVWPQSLDASVDTIAYGLLGGAGVLLCSVVARTMWLKKTWVPCIALGSCMRQAGGSYLIYGTLCTGLMLTLPYIAWLSYVRVQQVKPHIVAWVFSGVFTGLAIILSGHTIYGHLTQYFAPRLQKYIVRILLLVPIYAGCSCAETVFPRAAVYLTTFRELYEAYTLFNFITFLMVFLDNHAVYREIEQEWKERVERVKRDLEDSIADHLHQKRESSSTTAGGDDSSDFGSASARSFSLAGNGDVSTSDEQFHAAFHTQPVRKVVSPIQRISPRARSSSAAPMPSLPLLTPRGDGDTAAPSAPATAAVPGAGSVPGSTKASLMLQSAVTPVDQTVVNELRKLQTLTSPLSAGANVEDVRKEHPRPLGDDVLTPLVRATTGPVPPVPVRVIFFEVDGVCHPLCPTPPEPFAPAAPSDADRFETSTGQHRTVAHEFRPSCLAELQSIVKESEADGIETVLVMASCRFSKTEYGLDIVDSALEQAGLPRLLGWPLGQQHGRVGGRGVTDTRGQLSGWIHDTTKRDPSKPMNRPLRIEGLVVLRPHQSSGDVTGGRYSTGSPHRSQGLPVGHDETVREAECALQVCLGVEMPTGCVVEVNGAYGLREGDRSRVLGVLQTSIAPSRHPEAVKLSGSDPFLSVQQIGLGEEALATMHASCDASSSQIPVVATSMLVHPPFGWTPSESRELMALERYLRQLAPAPREEAGHLLAEAEGSLRELLQQREDGVCAEKQQCAKLLNAHGTLVHWPDGYPDLRNTNGISVEELIVRVLFRKRAGLRARQQWAFVRRYVHALGALGGLRKYKGHTTRAARLVQLEWAARADREEGLSTALYHLPPFCCMRAGAYFGGENLENGAQFLHACKMGVEQYVSLQVLLAIVTYILQAQDRYNAGIFRLDDPLHYTYAYIIIFRNLSQAWALYCLVMLYKGCAELLKPVDPIPKFASVKLVVFATFWQSMALSFLHALHLLPFEEWFIQIYLRDATMCAPEEADSSGSFADASIATAALGETPETISGHTDVFNVTEIELAHNITIVCEQVLVFGTRVADPAEFAILSITAAQNVLVCFEMFLAAVFHHFIFPAGHFRLRPDHGLADETTKAVYSDGGTDGKDQQVRRPTVGPGEAFLEVFDAREVSHLVTSWYSDRFDGTKRVLIHIRPRRQQRPITTQKSPSRHTTIDRSSGSLDGSPSRLSLPLGTPGRDVSEASLSTSPRQLLVSYTNSDPRINTQQFPDHLLEQLDLEVVYEVVEAVDGENPDAVGDGDGARANV